MRDLVSETKLVGDFLTTTCGGRRNWSMPTSAGFLERCQKPTNNVTVTLFFDCYYCA